MQRETLERLLTTLDVSLHGFAVCNVDANSRLVFEPMSMVVIHYVLRGEGFLESASEPPLRFGPGHILIVPASSEQALVGLGPVRRDVPAGESCAMLVDGLVEFNASEQTDDEVLTICSTVSATYGGSFGLFDAITKPLVRDLRMLDAVRGIFDLLLAERRAPDIGTRALTEALMKQCMILLVRNELHTDIVGSPLFFGLRDRRLATAITEVLRAPAAARTVEDLALLAGMSRSAFAAAFSAAFDQTPMDFVQKARLHHAAKLLIGSDLPVKVIAASMGFSSRSHFSRSFRRAYDVDPTSYRKRRQNTGEDVPLVSGRGWITRFTPDRIGGVTVNVD